MRMRHSFLAGVGLMVLGLVACSDSSSPGSGEMTASEAQEVADAAALDVDELLDASTLDLSTAVQLAPPSGVNGPVFPAPPPCFPTISPNPPANTDGDAVPDSVRFEFTDCSFSRGNFTLEISGIIDVLDPTGASDDFGVTFIFHDYAVSRTNTGVQPPRSHSVVRNGLRQVTGNHDAITHTLVDFRADHSFASGFTASLVKDWNATFTADVPGSIMQHQRLPGGILAVNGTATWTGEGGRTWSITTATENLHYAAACLIAPKFDSGTVTHLVTRNDVTTTVVVEHTGCGQYTVTRTVTP